MSVREILRTKGNHVVTVRPETGLAEAVRLLMRHGIGGLPVVDRNGSYVGLLSERDLVHALDATPGDVRTQSVAQAMHRPPPACRLDEPLQSVMQRMTRERLRHLVVLDGERIAGLISVGDIVRYRLQQLETETGVLRDIVAAQRAAT
jgi:CBS domain-containing protein